DLTTAAPPPWAIYSFVGSTGAGDDRWGDYYSSRRNGSNGNTWVISGQQLDAGQRQAWYVWMGRDRDAPPTEMTSPGVQGTSPTSASSDYLRFWWDDISRQRPPGRSRWPSKQSRQRIGCFSLRCNTFESHLAGVGEDGRAVAFDMRISEARKSP